MGENRLVIVSNRLPFRLAERDGNVVITPGAGGLVSSMSSYLDRKLVKGPTPEGSRPVWIGATELRARRLSKLLAAHGEQFEKGLYRIAPIALPDVTRDRHYNGFCNDTIWPLFHFFPSFVKYDHDNWHHYQEANRLFCEEVLKVVGPKDHLWIHDYHLMLLPRLVREQRPDLPISFFLHIPFPSFEVFRLLPGPWREQLLEGMLGADLVGFQTQDHVQYFLKSVQQLLGHDIELRQVRTPTHAALVDAFPIGIDTERFREAFDGTEVVEEKNRIRRQFAECKLLLSVDRLDYTKGILHRLLGFERFLELHPDMIGKVAYLLLIVPSRDAITKYKEIKVGIESAVSRINGRFGNISWQPILYQYRSVDHSRLCALYGAADVALIAPLRDGMNLVAKEYVAARKDRRGVLVLSETAGAANELGGALMVNPLDREALAGAIAEALAMEPLEQARRMSSMLQRIRRYDVFRWAGDIIGQLDEAVAMRRHLQVKEVTGAVRESIASEYRNAQRRVIVLDHDGTLAPLTLEPASAQPDKSAIRVLKDLSSDARNTLVIVSGRNRNDLDKWYGDMAVHLIAEHGAFERPPAGLWSEGPEQRTDWRPVVLSIMEQFCDRCAGSLVEQKSSGLAWHYRAAPVGLGFQRSRELINVLNDLARSFDFQVLEGSKVVEVRSVGIDKGTAVTKLFARWDPDFVLAIGDDRTDEDMFRSLPPGSVSIRIGMVPSFAHYNVRGRYDAMHLLEDLSAEAASDGRPNSLKKAST